jgi:hypothetical protein
MPRGKSEWVSSLKTICGARRRDNYVTGCLKIQIVEYEALGYRSGGPGSIPGTTRKKK